MEASEAERLAKAARAKALLKKHQKKRAAVPGAVSVSSPLAGTASSPPASVFSGPPSEFGDNAVPSEFGEIASPVQEKSHLSVVSPPPVPVPEPAPAPAPAPVLRPQAAPIENHAASLFGPPVIDVETQAQLDNQQQTINLLVEEKTTLSSTIQHLETRLDEATKRHNEAINEAKGATEELAVRISSLQEELQAASSEKENLILHGQEHLQRTYDLQRELEQSKRNLGDVQAKSEAHQSRIRELEEEVQANGRVESLERSLKGTQDRAESLEFQLSKSKQAHTKLKADFEALDVKHSALITSESSWRDKHSSLVSELSGLQKSLDTLTTAHATLQQQHESLTLSSSASQKALNDSEALLVTARKELSQVQAQLKRSTTDVTALTRRAEDAESAQQKLQAENVDLMASLNEMRPKVVELTQDKVNLGEEVDRLSRSVRVLTGTNSHLEGMIAETRAQLEKEKEESAQISTKWETEKAELTRQLKELETAYAEIEEDRKNATASVTELETQRMAHRRAVSQYEDQLESFGGTLQERERELEQVRHSLSETQRAESELKELLTQSQAEVENLQTEAAHKEQQIIRLSDQLAASTPATPSSPSAPNDSLEPRDTLGGEMLSAVQQQHTLELSNARSQIRSLESTIYTHENHSLALQRQISQLETEVASLRAQPTVAPTQRHAALVSPTAPISRTYSSHSIASNGERRPKTGPPIAGSRLLFGEAGLSADMKHKRKVSLSMLKARIDSERLAVAAANSATTSPAARLATLEESSPRSGTPDNTNRKSLEKVTHGQSFEHNGHPHHRDTGYFLDHSSAAVPERSQFRDESHIFWCHACSGDLVVL